MTVLRSGSATDVGRVRTTNQDMPLEAPNLFAVADGMGGHAAGEVAARIAVDTLRSSFTGHTSVDGLRQAVTDANAAVWRQSQLRSELRGMGTTLIAAALVPDTDGRDVIALANVGDSRAYVYSEAHIAQITADHSLAEEKVRHGELTEAEAAVHPHRHILTRALGVSSGVEVDLWELRLKAGDRLLLCSDGLTNEVDTTEIAGVLASETDPANAAHRLVETANEHGGNDNITAVVVDVLAGDGRVPPTGGPGPNGAVVAAVAPAPEAAVPAGDAEPATGGSAANQGGQGLANGVLASGAGIGAPPEDLTGAVPAQRGGGAVAAAREGSGTGVIAPPPPGAATDEGEGEPSPGRRERRRQRRLAGIPRRVTLRVLFFVVLLAAVVAAAYFLVRWYATDNWFVTLDGNQVVIYQGRPGGLLWFKPTVVQRTGLTTAHVLTRRIETLRADKQEPSLAQARRYVANLRQEYQSQQAIANGSGTGSTTTTTTVPPTTTTPTITTTTTPPPTSPLAAALPTTNGTF